MSNISALGVGPEALVLYPVGENALAIVGNNELVSDSSCPLYIESRFASRVTDLMSMLTSGRADIIVADQRTYRNLLAWFGRKYRYLVDNRNAFCFFVERYDVVGGALMLVYLTLIIELEM